MPSTKAISPSRLARFYFHECERFLRYSSVMRDAREAEGVPKPPHDPRPVTRAILESGASWEEEVIQDLLTGTVHTGEPDESGELSTSVIEPAEARRLVATISP